MSHIYTYICIPSQRFFCAGQVPRDDRRCQMANRSIGKQRGEGWGRGQGDTVWPWIPWMILELFDDEYTKTRWRVFQSPKFNK